MLKVTKEELDHLEKEVCIIMALAQKKNNLNQNFMLNQKHEVWT